jgi:UDP-N-acetylmuramate dehydrogenase
MQIRELEKTIMRPEPQHLPIDTLQTLFGDRLQRDVRMARFSSARVGGPVDFLVVSHSAQQLEADIVALWNAEIPFRLLGGASNVLVSKKGLPGLVLINHARAIQFQTQHSSPIIWAESGALMSVIVKRAASAGLSGLEWGTALPGTLGGAVYGNAGAFGSEISDNLIMAEILQADRGKEYWRKEDFAFQYRSSVLKRNRSQSTVILSVELQVQHGDQETIRQLMSTLKGKRETKQPPGACTGSMFKNPPGDFAGRLIEAAGLKGTRIGDVEISQKHGNFFINNGQGTAQDFLDLIKLTRSEVAKQFAVDLELEVELLGNWETDTNGYA